MSCFRRLPLGLAAACGSALAGDLVVTITNVPNTNGVVGIIACREATYLQSQCAYGVTEPAEVGEMVMIIEGIDPGEWGVLALHDENENGSLDFKWYGPPSEAYGASNNPPPRMGPARWEDIFFTVEDADVELEITLLGAN